MKKLLALLLAMVMVLSMAICFSACGGNDDDGKKDDAGIVGKWVGTADWAELLNTMFVQLLGEELSEYVELDSFKVKMTFEFEESGEYEMEIDEDSMEAAVEDAMAVWKEGFIGLIEKSIQDAGLNMTVDAYAQQAFGMSLDDYLANVANSMDMDDMNAKGEYKLDGKKLYTSTDDEDLEDVEEYYTIELDGDTFEFTAYSDEEAEGMFEMIFKGVEFKRQ